GDLRVRTRTARRGGAALRQLVDRRLVDRTPQLRELHRTRPRVPLPAGQGQFDRGRNVRDPAQHRRRARTRPAPGDPSRQGRALEGPAPVNTAAASNPASLNPASSNHVPDLLYSQIEEDLRASVRALLSDRSPWSAVLARCESDQVYDAALWRTLASDLGCA